MAIFLSAGHHLNPAKPDPGAVNKKTKRQENLESIRVREAVICRINALRPDIKVIKDRDEETLSQYLARIKPGYASVVCEIHFDSFSETSTGSTSIIPDNFDNNDKSFATELVHEVAKAIGIRNRGVITEKQSARGKLALMRKVGTVCLLEVCFISNENDMLLFDKNFTAVVDAIARVLIKYEDLIK